MANDLRRLGRLRKPQRQPPKNALVLMMNQLQTYGEKDERPPSQTLTVAPTETCAGTGIQPARLAAADMPITTARAEPHSKSARSFFNLITLLYSSNSQVCPFSFLCTLFHFLLVQNVFQLLLYYSVKTVGCSPVKLQDARKARLSQLWELSNALNIFACEK